METFIGNIREIVRWNDMVDILFVTVVVYRVLLLIRGTRAVQMLTGFGIILMGYFLSQKLQLHTLHTLLDQFFSNLIFILIIVFQEEIRKALTQVGRNPFFTSTNTIEEISIVDEICQGVQTLAVQRLGALVVIERETGLKNYIEAGVPLDSKVSADLLISIFQNASPIHDGAVIIRNARISSAGCLLPLSRDSAVKKEFGTRHRAALGLTQETDAVVVVVSEERAEISLAHQGKMERYLNTESLRKHLLDLLDLSKYESSHS